MRLTIELSCPVLSGYSMKFTLELIPQHWVR